MLQQTQVDRVLPKYEEWLTRYPSLDALAGADEADVVQTWRPLGYNIRPRRLQAIAREAVERYDGQLPSDEATLRSFKEIAVPLPPARSSASPSGSAPQSSTPTWRECCSASSSAPASRRRTR